ncbi:MAG: HAD family phosphatase [Acidobacteria bacterium]|nr:MAG: HAD family phosphatase [Acidobacteriota bacterium]
MSSVRLIAIDIDGTLLNSNYQVSARDLETLQRAHSLGVEIVLATGRRHTFALPVAQALGFEVTLISSNGAVTKSSDGSLFHKDPLPLAAVRELVQHMTDFRRNLVVTFDDGDQPPLVLESLDELNESIKKWLEKNAQYIRYVCPVEEALTDDPIQAMFCGTVERMITAQKHLQKNKPLLTRITALKTQYAERDLCMLDILNKGCTKGAALRRWANYREFAPEEVMAIGDNYNDIEMLEFAGHPYIMGNATEELRDRGWNTTLTNNENGVAMAIEAALEGIE